ncbi:MAG: aldehyde ferredoxin oxidoreductase family protein [Deltaproteobacteria bacterium]|nr:aldehyde ferredoxin oxidoreductase family protein [Deltaproteobacteria bacterium]
MKSKGYMGRILTVDLSRKQISQEELTDEVARKYIGGCGLGAKILNEETGINTDPIGEENVLIFATGPLTGSNLFNTNRFDIVTKSPLTGIFAESSAGGYWGKEFKQCGYDALVIKGKSVNPVYLNITDQKVEIEDASFIWSKDTFACTEKLRKKQGEKAKVAVIGPAGEKMVKLANIITDGKHGRAAGRCGIGAVMGSKNLKAVVVNGGNGIDVADKNVLNEINKAMAVLIRKNMKQMEDAGTGSGLLFSEKLGNLPIKNWYQGSWTAGARKTTGMTLTRDYLVRTYKCGNCMIKCGRVVKVKEGPYAGEEIAGPEYETLALMGANLLNDDLPTIIKANELCNRYGLDTISTAGVIGFAMELYARGLLQDFDIGRIKPEWGSKEAILEMIRLIGERKRFGTYLGEGVRILSERIGGIAKEFSAHIKGLEPPAHDGRAKFTAAIGMATSNRGACHLSGFTHDFEEGAVIEDLGTPPLTDRFTSRGKAENVYRMQNLMGMFDSLLACKFALFGGLTVNPLIKAINAATGWRMDREEFFKTGERIFNLKRLYNNRLGITRKDDVLPIRMMRHKRGGGTNILPPLNEMLDEYYTYRGWDELGKPTRMKLKELELESFIL